MSIYAISDLHLSLSIDKPMDIFGSKWENYIERLKENWQSLIKENDTVLIPGDISWATYLEDSYNDFEFINSLNGKKIILKGNHDYWWSTMSKIKKYMNEQGFESIEFLHNTAVIAENTVVCGSRGWSIPKPNSAEEDIKIFEREKIRLINSLENAKKISGERIVVCMHYPPVEQGNENRDFINIMKEYKVEACIYGHLHDASHKRAIIGDFSGIKLKLVSADYLKFSPVLLYE